MTTAQFIASIEAKPQFIKWAKAPVVFETIGDVEKWNGIAFITTPDGTNTFNVWFMVDGGQATWMTADTMQPEKNQTSVQMTALTDYLKANFNAFFIGRSDLVNKWIEAEVYTVSGADLVKSTVLVFKQGTNPITHRKII